MELLDKNREHILGVFRMIVGFLFACHGAATLFNVLGGAFGGQPKVGEWPGWWAALIQLVGGALVFFGLGTRGAALISSGSMAYAYFTKHQPHEIFPIQNGGEPAVMFCWTFLLIAFLGSGSFSLGALISRQRASAATTVNTGHAEEARIATSSAS
jgi:putative oxidoreductase